MESINKFNHFNINTITKDYYNIHSYYSNDTVFNQWLAGLIDGDGYFYNLSNKYPSLTIDMERKNMPLLNFIHSRIGGIIMSNIKGRPNVVRLTIRKRVHMLDLVNRVNGNIRNSVRVPQLKSVCLVLNVQFLTPTPLTPSNAWFTGFFDADGTIIASFTSSFFIKIHVTNKHHSDLESYRSIFNGSLNAVRTSQGVVYAHRWSISSKSDILAMNSYFKLYPPISHKASRVDMIEEYYGLYNIEAYKFNSPHYSKWLSLAERWKTEF